MNEAREGNGGGWDTRTREGRAALDKAVAKALSARTGQYRGEIAKRIAAPERWVSAALRRLVASGAATRHGQTNAPTYTRAVKGGAT